MQGSVAISLLAAAVALPTHAAEPHKTLMEWARETRAARLKGDYRAWLDAGLHSLALASDHPDLLISVARARAGLGQAKESLELLRQAIDRGAGIDIPRLQEFQKLPPSPQLDGLVARARRNLEPVPGAKLFALLPDPTASSEASPSIPFRITSSSAQTTGKSFGWTSAARLARWFLAARGCWRYSA